jgi:hypothetical protein
MSSLGKSHPFSSKGGRTDHIFSKIRLTFCVCGMPLMCLLGKSHPFLSNIKVSCGAPTIFLARSDLTLCVCCYVVVDVFSVGKSSLLK